jgi:hypothetical protein
MVSQHGVQGVLGEGESELFVICRRREGANIHRPDGIHVDMQHLKSGEVK